MPDAETDRGIFHIESKRVVVPDTGTNVASLFKQPGCAHLVNHPDIKHEFEISNPGEKEAVVVLPGLHQTDVERFKKSRMFGEFVNGLSDSVVMFNWSKHTWIPPYTAAQLEDLCINEGFESIKLLGISYGGYAALELIADMKRRSLPIRVSGLVTVVSPTSVEDFNMGLRLQKSLAIIPQQLIFGWMSLTAGRVPDSVADFRSTSVKLRAFREKPFTKDEIMSDVPVLAITTEDAHFIHGLNRSVRVPDLLVDNRQAAQTLGKLFNEVEVVEVGSQPIIQTFGFNRWPRINILGGHGLASSEVPGVHQQIMDFMKRIDVKC